MLECDFLNLPGQSDMWACQPPMYVFIYFLFFQDWLRKEWDLSISPLVFLMIRLKKKKKNSIFFKNNLPDCYFKPAPGNRASRFVKPRCMYLFIFFYLQGWVAKGWDSSMGPLVSLMIQLEKENPTFKKQLARL
jgi:hypothetical protein